MLSFLRIKMIPSIGSLFQKTHFPFDNGSNLSSFLETMKKKKEKLYLICVQKD